LGSYLSSTSKISAENTRTYSTSNWSSSDLLGEIKLRCNLSISRRQFWDSTTLPLQNLRFIHLS